MRVTITTMSHNTEDGYFAVIGPVNQSSTASMRVGRGPTQQSAMQSAINTYCASLDDRTTLLDPVAPADLVVSAGNPGAGSILGGTDNLHISGESATTPGRIEKILRAAEAADQEVTLRYEDARGNETVRQIKVGGILGDSLLRAWDIQKGEPRHFALARIQEVST